MRLLNARTLELSEFLGSSTPPYAILSHTWADEEVSFVEMQVPIAKSTRRKKGYEKIAACCRLAQHYEIEWVWADTCCIDKRSSAELSEAINSMYAYYRQSAICFAYLQDVGDIDERASATYAGVESDIASDIAVTGRDDSDSSFNICRWFTRGWCLQELIAPRQLEFFSHVWTGIGTKLSRASEIEKITGIRRDAFLSGSHSDCCIAEKLSWASKRETTRVEDEAYCLLGLMGITMPLLYGEGDNAFLRLQQVLVGQLEDLSFLLWTANVPSISWQSCLALPTSPHEFRHCTVRKVTRHGGIDEAYEMLDYSNLENFESRSFLDGAELVRSIEGESRSHDPPVMTGRGLKVHLFADQFLYRQDLGPDLLTWTGCVYQDDYYVCVVLCEMLGALYCRTALDTLLLFHRKEFPLIRRTELYLSTNPRSRYTKAQIQPELPILNRRLYVSVGCIIGRPRWHVALVDRSGSMLLARKESMKDQDIHTTSIMTGLYRKEYDCLFVLSWGTAFEGCLKFRIRSRDDEDSTSPNVLFVVRLWQRSSFPCCNVSASSTEAILPVTLRSLVGLPGGIVRPDVEEDVASDRSICKLANGLIVSAKITSRDWVQDKPLHVVINVT